MRTDPPLPPRANDPLAGDSAADPPPWALPSLEDGSLAPALRTTLGLMKANPLPMLVWWGPEFSPYCNEAYARLIDSAHLRLRPEEWGGSWPAVAADRARVRNSGQVVWHENMPLPLPHTPQGEYCGTFSFNPIRDDSGVAGVLFMCTRHYRSNTVHLDGRFGYAAVIHSMDVGFAIVEALDTPPGQLLDYRYIEVNAAWAKQTGLKDVQGKRITDVVTVREPFWPQTIAQVIETGVAMRSTRESQTWDRILDVFVMRLGGSGSRQVALLARDVTQECRAVEALQRSEQRARAEAERAETERHLLDAVLEAIPAPVFVVDARNQFLRANSCARLEWGDHPQIDSHKWMGWWADGTARQGQRLRREEWPLDRALRGEFSRDILEIASPRDARQRKIYLVSGAPILDEGGQVQGAVVAAMDITDRVRAEQALQESHQRKDEFLAMLAHELRNPLAPIGAAAELMSRPHSGKELMLRTSAIIARQVRHMTGLVDDLLDMSRVNRGTITLDKEFLDTSSVMNDAIEQVTPLLRAKRHRLDVTPPAHPLLFEGDRKRVIQVLSNLLNNAIKYTPEGGRIQLTMSQVDALVEIRVKDNGLGMDSEMLERAFDLFTQAKRSSDRQQGGLGIGLALVKKLVELHGGEVSAHSPGPGRGSEFVVRLPTCRDPAPLRSKASPSKRPAARGLQVMVVDDHVDAALTLSMLIEAEGYTCTVGHDPEQALEQAAQQPPDVCVLDIGLPRMDGRELARRLRSQPETAQTLLIALSGYAQPEDRKAAISAGFDHYLVKPVDSSRLLELLAERAMLLRRKAQQETDTPAARAN